MNPQIEQLEDILDALINAMEQALQSGEELPEDIQMMVAEEITGLTQEIEQLYAQQEQPTQEQPQQQEGEQPHLPPQQPQQGLGPPPSETARLLWVLAGNKEDYFTEYLQNYPSPDTQALLNNPAELERVIKYLHAEMPSGQPPVENGIPHADINSSNIYGFRYDPSSKKLYVRFQGGSVYGYDGVPFPVYKMFANGAVPARTNGQNRFGRWWRGKVPSLGSSFYSLIRNGNYNYQRIS